MNILKYSLRDGGKVCFRFGDPTLSPDYHKMVIIGKEGIAEMTGTVSSGDKEEGLSEGDEAVGV